MLLAVPLQGYTAATTLLCAPFKTAAGTIRPQGTPAHDHQAMLMLAGHDAHFDGAGMPARNAETSDMAFPGHDAGDQCNACSACCTGAAMAASQVVRMPVEAEPSTFFSLESQFAPAVDLALPERPPQAPLT